MNNDKQREHWNGPMAEAWIAMLDQLEHGLAAINAALMDFAVLEPGMRVIDIGCGPGTTTEEIALRILPGGSAVGLDISGKLIDAAIARFGTVAHFIEADAADHPFRPEFDLVFSRLGLMFFAEPVAAFANIRRALKPGGRLAALTWGPMEEIPYLFEALGALRDLFPPLPPTPPNEPGGFALADKARLHAILEASGWRNIRIEKIRPPSFLGETLDAAVEQLIAIGPYARAFREADAATQKEARSRLHALLAKYETPSGIAPPSSCWLFGANA